MQSRTRFQETASIVGGVCTKMIAPILAQQIGQGFSMNREDTAEQNALDANAVWEAPEGFVHEKINRNGSFLVRIMI